MTSLIHLVLEHVYKRALVLEHVYKRELKPVWDFTSGWNFTSV